MVGDFYREIPRKRQSGMFYHIGGFALDKD